MMRGRPVCNQANAGKGRFAAADLDNELPEEIGFYRRRTEAILRQYLRLSLEVGRVPSCMPKEALRAKVSYRKGGTFEDRVIFVHDIEKCLSAVDRITLELLTRLALQEYTQREAAEMMGISQRHVGRSYDDALDRMSGLLLKKGLMGA